MDASGDNVTAGIPISLVIPACDEEENLEQLLSEVAAVAGANSLDLEIIFVDDGSCDGTWACISRLAQADGRVSGIRFRRNFGKAAALAAGFAVARGRIVFTLDADLQDDPHEIPRFIDRLNQGFDVVTGWKQNRHDPWHKVVPSRVFNRLVSAVTGLKLHDHNCGFKCYKREVLDEINLYGELHRFIPVLAHARGFRVAEIVVHHRARIHGYSKYGVRRFVKGFLDLITVKFLTGFGRRPSHVLGSVGLTALGLGGVGLAYLILVWLLGHRPIGIRPLLSFSVLSVLLGTQMVSLGILAELMAAHDAASTRAQYSIQERTSTNQNDGDCRERPDAPTGTDVRP